MIALTEQGETEALKDALAPLAKALPQSVISEFDPGNVATVRALMVEVGQSLPVALLEAGGAQ